jgi:hypothetical protein
VLVLTVVDPIMGKFNIGTEQEVSVQFSICIIPVTEFQQLGMIPGFKMLNVPYVVLYRNILHAFACGA